LSEQQQKKNKGDKNIGQQQLNRLGLERLSQVGSNCLQEFLGRQVVALGQPVYAHEIRKQCEIAVSKSHATVHLLLSVNEERQILGHLSAIDGINADLLQSLSKLEQLRGVVKLGTMHQPTLFKKKKKENENKRMIEVFFAIAIHLRSMRRWKRSGWCSSPDPSDACDNVE
jgi:hypothetical protein